jgi:hypothetical protein
VARRQLDLVDIAEGRKPRKPMKEELPSPEEREIQRAIVSVLDRFLRPTWRYTHFPAGGERPAVDRVKNGEKVRVSIAALQLRADGLKPGWPDLQLLAPTGIMHFLEVKRSAKAAWQDEQLAFQAHCHKHGIPHRVAWDVDMAMAVFSEWDCLTIKIGGRLG